jgi:hypothetical protein
LVGLTDGGRKKVVAGRTNHHTASSPFIVLAQWAFFLPAS